MLKLSIALVVFRSLDAAALIATVTAGHENARIAFAALLVLFLISTSKLSIRLTQERTIDALATKAFGPTMRPERIYRGNDR